MLKIVNIILVCIPHCGVKNAVQMGKIHPQRYQNYLQLLQEVKEGKKIWRKK